MAIQADIVAAIAQIDEDAGGLDKKPNVADVESLLGEDITASERDEAWDEFKSDSPGEQGDTTVTNSMSNPIDVFGVTIAPGKTGSVPDFDSAKPVIATWLEENLISVD